MFRWYSGLAGFSNCWGRNQPCLSASSLACFTIPEPRFAAGLRITLAPRPFMSLRRSTENESAMMATNG